MSQHRLIIPQLPRERFSNGGYRSLQAEIKQRLMQTASGIDRPNFLRIATSDLWLLYQLYDEHFCDGAVAATLAENRVDLSFRLSPRFTNAGGKTTWYPPNTRAPQRQRVEIAISTTLLFESFVRDGEQHVVVGCPCESRVEALLRIFEHELLHLFEFHDTGNSSCARRPFKQLARDVFGHEASHHHLLRPADRARRVRGIQPGSAVCFTHEGRLLHGRVQRITKRATVLVPDPHGIGYSDGHKYAKFYVPLGMLTTVQKLEA